MGIFIGPKIADGLVLYLDAGNTKSYPGSGTTWYDLSGKGNHATLYNSPTWSSTNGGTFTFNGSDHYAAPAAGFADFTSGITIFSIVNFGSGTTETLIDFGNGVGSDNFIFRRGGGTGRDLVWNIYNGTTDRDIVSTTFGAGILNSNASHAVTHDNSNVKFYRNGVLNGSLVSYPYTLTNITRNNCYIGRPSNDASNPYFGGTINVIMIYNRALSDVEIQQNFNALRVRFGI